MQIATEILLTELAMVDEHIAAMLRGTKEAQHAAECITRDRLTGRHGLIPFEVLRSHEIGVINYLGLGYLIPEQLEQLVQQMRQLFKGADRRVSMVNGHKASAYLEASLEAKLRTFAAETNGNDPIPYHYDEQGYTLPGIDYFVSQGIMHSTLGPGTVTAVKGDYKEKEYIIVAEFDSGEVIPLIVRKSPHPLPSRS